MSTEIAVAAAGNAAGVIEAPMGGISPDQVVLPTNYESKDAVIQDVSDWDEQGDAFIDFLNANAAPNGDTGIQSSSQNFAQAGQPTGQPTDANAMQTNAPATAGNPAVGNTAASNSAASVAAQAAQDAQTSAQTQGTTPVAQASTVASGPGETLETLRGQITELQSAKTFMESQDYKDAKAVMDEFRKDPTGFYEKYLPQSLANVQNRQAVATMRPEDYVRQSTDHALASKYGKDFMFDPGEALIPGTPSYEWQTDRQIFLQQATQGYYQETARQQQQAAAQAEEINTSALRVLADMQIPGEKWSEVRAMAEAIEVTPEIQIRLALTYLDQMGKLTQFRTPQTGAPNGQAVGNVLPFRPSVEMPTPGVQSIPGGEAARPAMQGLNEVFPESMLYGNF